MVHREYSHCKKNKDNNKENSNPSKIKIRQGKKKSNRKYIYECYLWLITAPSVLQKLFLVSTLPFFYP